MTNQGSEHQSTTAAAPATAVLAVKVEPLRASLTRTLTAPRDAGATQRPKRSAGAAQPLDGAAAAWPGESADLAKRRANLDRRAS
jgi:hypothetical protein